MIIDMRNLIKELEKERVVKQNDGMSKGQKVWKSECVQARLALFN